MKRRAENTMVREADFVVVGSGSAGSALAYRLSESGRYSVLVIEYGGSDVGPFIQMPAALSFPMNMPHYDWGYRSDPEPGLSGRRLACPRGKVIGGSSSINGMVYVRGHARDFDTWQELGAKGWSFKDVLPYFMRMEDAVHSNDPLRGHGGPLHVTRSKSENPLFASFLKAGEEAGYQIVEDYNGLEQEGFSRMQRTIWKGRRWSTASAYLRPAIKNKDVQIVRGLATGIELEGRCAKGVRVKTSNGDVIVNARREVILAASAINTPKLLMLSGIGPADHLKEHGIEVVTERKGVGANLQDHLEVYIQQTCKQPVTLNSKLNLLSKALIGAQWLMFKSGLGASNHFGGVAFLRSASSVEYPDIQFHFLPVAVRYDGKAAAKGHGYQIHTGPMRSKSRGRVRLNSSAPEQAPSILFNYMSHPDDWTEFRQAIRLARNVFSQPAFEAFAGEEIQPGASCTSDADLDQFIREHAESAYHPCGTAKMGHADDLTSVVDHECKVIGIENLRVADSSIFPQITYGNLNAPSIMVGEKVADHILGREPLECPTEIIKFLRQGNDGEIMRRLSSRDHGAKVERA